MSGRQQEQPTHRVMWWTRAFGRPLQAEIGGVETDTPDEFHDLLEMADKRLNNTRSPPQDS